MLLARKRYFPVALIAGLFIAMVMLFGITAQADAAEYKSVSYSEMEQKDGITCNGVKLHVEYTTLNIDGEYVNANVYQIGDYEIVIKQYYDGVKYHEQLNTLHTNGSYVYYTVGKFNNTSSKTYIKKLNLSTGKTTTVKTISNNNNISLAGVYGSRIYYLTNKGDSKNTNGALKCYKTDTKKTTTINSSVTEVPGSNGRYMYMWLNEKGYFQVYDTHTAKLIRTLKTWSTSVYGMQILGKTSSKVVLSPFDNYNNTVYRIDNSGANKTTLVTDATGLNVDGSYLYYIKGDKYYQMKISDKTKSTITKDEYVKHRGW